MGVACETDESSIQGFGGETWGKEPLGRPRRNDEDTTGINLTEMQWKGNGRTDMAHNVEEMAGCYKHCMEHSGSIKWEDFLG